MTAWKHFSPEGRIYQVLSAYSNALIGSVLWIVCSLPIITAGAAACALYAFYDNGLAETMGVARFFAAFKKHLIFGVLLEIVLAGLAVLGYAWILLLRSGEVPQLIGMPIFAVFCLLYGVCSFLVPTRAKLCVGPKETIRMGIFLALKAPWYTLLKAVLTALPLLLCVLFPSSLYWVLPMLILGGIGALCALEGWLYTIIIEKQKNACASTNEKD